MTDLARLERHERRLGMLRELAERGLSLARLAARRALAGPARADMADAYLKLAQEIRLTIALEAKLDAEGRAAGLTSRHRPTRLGAVRPPLALVERPRDDEIN